MINHSLQLAYTTEYYWKKSFTEYCEPDTEPLRSDYLWLGQIGLQQTQEQMGIRVHHRIPLLTREPTPLDAIELAKYAGTIERRLDDPHLTLALNAMRHYVRSQHPELSKGASDYKSFIERARLHLL